MSGHPFSSAHVLTHAIRSGAVSSVEAVTYFQERIERLNPALNAVVLTDFERAREAAAAADRRLAQAPPAGSLHGLPLTVKESLSVRGLPTTSGAATLREHVPEADAHAVARLRNAGAVIMGKTNLSTFCGDWQSSNPLYGMTNNPWNAARTAGGSSGGAAAAVAAGLTPLEVGSDIGGSVRIPAHYCGVYGHKSSYGLVPMQGHIPGPPGMKRRPDLAVIGPLAPAAEDLRLGLAALAGPAGADARAYALSLPPARATSVAELRVAVWFEDRACLVDNAIGSHFERLVPALEKAGATVQVGSPDGVTLEQVKTLFEPRLGAEIGAGIGRSVYQRMSEAPPGERLPLEKNPHPGRTAAYLDGMVMSHRQWLAVEERSARLAARLEEFFREVDVLITPVVPFVAFPHDVETPFYARTITVNGEPRHYLDHLPWVGLATLTGAPATVAPLGLTQAGLPVGAQIVGPAFGDLTTIAAAAALREVTGDRPIPPGFE